MTVFYLVNNCPVADIIQGRIYCNGLCGDQLELSRPFAAATCHLLGSFLFSFLVQACFVVVDEWIDKSWPLSKPERTRFVVWEGLGSNSAGTLTKSGLQSPISQLQLESDRLQLYCNVHSRICQVSRNHQHMSGYGASPETLTEMTGVVQRHGVPENITL